MKALRTVRPAPEIELEDAAGTIYPLSYPDRFMQSISGLGMPPIRHWTTRSPFQAGETHWGYAVAPRVINLTLFLKGCDRADYWAKRRANVAMLMPSGGPHKLRLITPDIKKYELHDVWVTGGYELSSDDNMRNSRVQTGGVQLTAYDPMWKWVNSPLDVGETRDADGRTCVETSAMTTRDELQLAFTGPFNLGTTTATATLTCTNDGTWETKTTITVEGPTSDWTLINATTGYALYWDGYDIAAGETVTIDIPAKTCTSSLVGDVSIYLSGDTGSFALDPGANTINFWSGGDAVNAVTTIGVCWYLELVGV